MAIDIICDNAGICGGCVGIFNDYDLALQAKFNKARDIFKDVAPYWDVPEFYGSPASLGYRNKMEYSFGDTHKGGELTLGLHKKRSFYDIVSAERCLIAPEVFGRICGAVLEFCQKKGFSFYHKKTKSGYLRHLLLRTGTRSGEILVGIVTTSQGDFDWARLTQNLIDVTDGSLTGFVHIINDSPSDVVLADKTVLLYGRDYFFEKILDLSFKVSLFSFFQTNSLGAEILYIKVKEYVDSVGTKSGLTLDLYCGTGTIAQLVAKNSKDVIGIELSAEAVNAARENALSNGIENCEFYAGDAFKVMEGLELKPDLIIMDPPRDGASPKALRKILDYGVGNVIYVSCKPESLRRDMAGFLHYGYEVVRMCMVDMFPYTEQVECVVLLQRLNM